IPQLPQRRVDTPLNRRELLAGQLCDLGDRQVGPVPQGDRLTLVIVEALEPACQEVAVLDVLHAAARFAGSDRDGALERPRLRRALPYVVPQAVERDRVEPGLLAAASRVVPTARAQHALEGLRDEILGERAVARSVHEEAEQRLG